MIAVSVFFAKDIVQEVWLYENLFLVSSLSFIPFLLSWDSYSGQKTRSFVECTNAFRYVSISRWHTWVFMTTSWKYLFPRRRRSLEPLIGSPMHHAWAVKLPDIRWESSSDSEAVGNSIVYWKTLTCNESQIIVDVMLRKVDQHLLVVYYSQLTYMEYVMPTLYNGSEQLCKLKLVYFKTSECKNTTRRLKKPSWALWWLCKPLSARTRRATNPNTSGKLLFLERARELGPLF